MFTWEKYRFSPAVFPLNEHPFFTEEKAQRGTYCLLSLQ